MTEKYIATGRIHPERADVRFSKVTWDIPGEGKVTASCNSSQITVVLELSHIDGWIAAHLAAEHFAYIIIGAVGFSLGSGYSVEIIQITEDDGTPHVIGVRPTGISPDETLGFTPHDEVVNRAFKLANTNIFFRLALRDYIRALNDATDCPTYCYRALESIKSAFVFSSGKDDWKIMHDALGTEQNTIVNTIKNFADPIRHGNWIEAKVTNNDDRWQMLLLTRDILIKFMDYELINE